MLRVAVGARPFSVGLGGSGSLPSPATRSRTQRSSLRCDTPPLLQFASNPSVTLTTIVNELRFGMPSKLSFTVSVLASLLIEWIHYGESAGRIASERVLVPTAGTRSLPMTTT
jgi:hypothetical protein